MENTKVIKVCDWEGHVNPYVVRTTGKHPVHMIEGGDYITFEDFNNGSGDMGWFWLNERDYQYMCNHLIDAEVEVR